MFRYDLEAMGINIGFISDEMEENRKYLKFRSDIEHHILCNIDCYSIDGLEFADLITIEDDNFVVYDDEEK